jgi:uncharacterized membrane protein YagU involved in acid resistance
MAEIPALVPAAAAVNDAGLPARPRRAVPFPTPMNNATATTAESPLPAWRALVAGGLVCGVLDINAAFLSAWINAGMAPARLLKAVASGLLGAEAFNGGAGVAAFGLLLHFCVAFSWAALFVLLGRRFRFLAQHAVISGLLYGAFVYFAMQHAVLPLAAQFRSLYIPRTKPFVPGFAWPQFCIHLTCVGLAIALSVRHWSRPASYTPRPAGHPSS